MSQLEALGVIALTLGGTFLFDQLLGWLIRKVRPAWGDEDESPRS